MGTALRYIALGFRNAFSPIEIKMTKSYGQIAFEVSEKRKAAIEKEKNRRRTAANKKQ